MDLVAISWWQAQGIKAYAILLEKVTTEMVLISAWVVHADKKYENSKANLVAIETGLKIELDLISVQNLF